MTREEWFTTYLDECRRAKQDVASGFTPEEAKALQAVLPNPGVKVLVALILSEEQGTLFELSVADLDLGLLGRL